MKETKRLHVFLLATLFEKVRREAYARKTSMTEIVTEALRDYFSNKK